MRRGRRLIGLPALALALVVVLSLVPPAQLRAANSSIAPTSIARGPDGNLWFTEFNGGHIGRITPAGAISVFRLPLAVFTQGITAGPDGNVWFGAGGNEIGRVTPAGRIRLFALPPAGHFILSFAAGPDGNVWFTDLIGNAVGRISPAGRILEFRFGPGRCPFPAFSSCGARAIAPGPDGALWVAMADRRLGRIAPGGSMRFFPLPAGADQPVWLTPGAPGCSCLWYSYPAGLARIGTTGKVSVYRLPPGTPAPGAIALGPDGNIWFASTGAVGRFAPRGGTTAIVFRRPGESITGIAGGPDGALWFTENQSDRIGRVTVQGAAREFAIPAV